MARKGHGQGKRLTLSQGQRDMARRNTLPYMPGSNRMSVVNDMVRRSTIHLQNLDSLVDINKLEWQLLNSPMNIKNIQLADNWEEIFVRRKTMTDLRDDLDRIRAERELEEWDIPKSSNINKYIYKKALKKLESDTFKQLLIIYNCHIALMKDIDRDVLPSFSPFGWTIEDFMERRLERSTAWLDKLLALNEKDLEMLKFKFDLDELFKLLHVLFESLGTESAEAQTSLLTFMKDAHEYLAFPQYLQAEAKQNSVKLHKEVNTYLEMLKFKRSIDEEALKNAMEQKYVDLMVGGPIELRYEINWMHNKTDQAIMKIQMAIDEMEKKANDYRKEEAKENTCETSILNMYYMNIDSYKRKIAELSAKFDAEFERAENDISYKKLSIDKLRDQRKQMEEKMIRFEQDIIALRQKEIDDQIAEEERLLEEQRLAEEAALKKAKKKGKKK